jgi:membrane-bound lytic murein transglycosylase D
MPVIGGKLQPTSFNPQPTKRVIYIRVQKMNSSGFCLVFFLAVCLPSTLRRFPDRSNSMLIAGRMIMFGAAAIGVFFFMSPKAYGEPDAFPSLISAIKINQPLDFCKERVPMEDEDIRERMEKELLVCLWDRAQVILWLKRSGRYLPQITETLKRNEMPEDLKYVAIAESGLRSYAGSTQGAVGFWQFMTSTGLRYGLEIDENKDERRNFFASTDAAITYFKDLYQKFGSWTMAAAAYNMGEDGLMAEVLEQETNIFYNLYLPLETQQYIFKILAIKLIFSDPEKYGFKLTGEDYYSPLPFDRVRVDCPQDMPVRIIARAGQTNFKTIKDLNPEIRGYYLPRGAHDILVPKGASAGFQDRYQRLTGQYAEAQKENTYVVQKGDSLSTIAQQLGIPLKSIIIWNRLDFDRTIHPGDRLFIFKKETPRGDTP